MSTIYNMVGGYNKAARHVLAALRFRDSAEIPRFRDAYFKWKDDAKTVAIAVVLTRTGGGNSKEYAAENAALAARPDFIRRYDDDYDNTYALFEYDVPSKVDQMQIVYFLKRHDQAGQCMYPTLKEKFEAFQQRIRDMAVGGK